MSQLLSANDIASLALERVGAFVAADSEPDPRQMGRALTRLDMIVAELAGTMRCLWLVKKLAVVPITIPCTGDFDLITQAAGAIQPQDMQFIVDAKLRYGTTGDDYPLERLDQRGWDAIQAKTTTGTNFSGNPERIFIDRAPRLPHVYINPVPATAGFSLVLALQSYAPDLTLKEGGVTIGMETAWNRYLEYQTAFDIGGGPVVRLPHDVLAGFDAVATRSKNKLIAFNAQSGVYPRKTVFRDF